MYFVRVGFTAISCLADSVSFHLFASCEKRKSLKFIGWRFNPFYVLSKTFHRQETTKNENKNLNSVNGNKRTTIEKRIKHGSNWKIYAREK